MYVQARKHGIKFQSIFIARACSVWQASCGEIWMLPKAEMLLQQACPRLVTHLFAELSHARFVFTRRWLYRWVWCAP